MTREQVESICRKGEKYYVKYLNGTVDFFEFVRVEDGIGDVYCVFFLAENDDKNPTFVEIKNIDFIYNEEFFREYNNLKKDNAILKGRNNQQSKDIEKLKDKIRSKNEHIDELIEKNKNNEVIKPLEFCNKTLENDNIELNSKYSDACDQIEELKQLIADLACQLAR